MNKSQSLLQFYSPKQVQKYIKEQNKTNNKIIEKLYLSFSQQIIGQKTFSNLVKDLNALQFKELNHFILALDQKEEEDDEEEEEEKNKEGEEKVEKNKLSLDQISEIFNFLQKQQKNTLKGVSLYLDGNMVKNFGEQIKNFFSQFQDSLEIVELSLNDNLLNSEFLGLLFEGVSQIKNMKRFQLLIDGNKLKNCEQFFGQFQKAFENFKFLEHFEISFSEIGTMKESAVVKIWEIMLETFKKNIENTDFFGKLNHFEMHFDGALLKCSDHLTILQNLVQEIQNKKVNKCIVSLFECRGFKSQHLKKIRDIQNNHRTYKINFDDHKEEWKDFYKFKQHLQADPVNLENFTKKGFELQFDFTDQAIMEHDIKFLFEKIDNLKEKVQILDFDLSQNDLEDNSLKILANFVKSCQKLRKLDLNLSKNEFSEQQVIESLNANFYDSFKYVHTFALDLFGNKKIGESGIKNILEKLSKNDRVIQQLNELKLYFGDNKKFSNNNCDSICEVVKKGVNIEDLSISIMKCGETNSKISYVSIKKILQSIFNDNLIVGSKNIELSLQEIQFQEKYEKIDEKEGGFYQYWEKILNYLFDLLLQIRNIHLWSVEIDLSGNDLTQSPTLTKLVKKIETQFPMIEIVMEKNEGEDDEEESCEEEDGEEN